ncbi:MAG: YqaJ viral recombinase family protein [Fervidobacterium sp.]
MRIPEQFVRWEVASELPEDRTRFYGGSDMPAIVGEDPYKTRLMVWYEKLGRWKTEEPTDAMRLGKLFEKPIAELLRQKTGYVVYDEVPAARKELHGISLPLIGHADAVALINGEPVIVEIKNLNQFNNQTDHYKWQVLFYMFVYGIKKALLVVLHGGSRLTIDEYEFDEEALNYMLEKLREFDRYLVTETRPEPVGSEREVEMLLRLQEGFEGAIEIEDALIDEYLSLGEQIKELERKQNEVKARILQLLEENNANLGIGSLYMAKVIKGVRKVKPVLEEKEVPFTQLRVVKRKGGDEQ